MKCVRPDPRRVATLEVILKKWKMVLSDCAVWRHPKKDSRTVIGLMMEQGSRFLVGKILVEGTTKNPKAEQYQRFFEENWQPYFGCPDVLRFDAEGTWRARGLDEFFGEKKIMLDPIPGDAHWHISPLERSIGWIKEFLSKQVADHGNLDTSSALAAAISTWNKREPVRGYSPFQHALGQAPDLDGRFFQSEIAGLPVDLMENPEGEHERAQQQRLAAEETFVRWQSKERINRALQSKGRKWPEFFPGDVVFYWRNYIKKGQNGQRIQTGSVGGYAGPARILAMETRRDEDGNCRPSLVVCATIDCSKPQSSLRRASEREEVLDDLARPPNMPWTMTELARPLGREEYDDISAEGPPPEQVTTSDAVARF